jgi:hypothetical protein
LEKELFVGLLNLNRLVVNGNSLKSIDSNIFKNTPNLYLLDLSGNALEEVPNLDGLQKLNLVNLNDNNLLGLTKQSFYGVQTGLYLFVSQHEICECYVPYGVNCSASSYRSPFLTCDRL